MKSIQNIQTKDLVVQILREQILSGDLKPGEELTQEDVAEKLGVSRMPVREALQALTQEGFLTRMRNRHVCVSRMKRTQVLESFRIMAVVESEMLGMLDEPAAQVLVNHIEETIKILEQGREDRGRELELEYHWLVGELLENPYLQQMLKKLQEGYLSYVLLKLPFIQSERLVLLQQLGNAVRKRECSVIKDVLVRYFQHLADILLSRATV
ncbi:MULTISPECIES: GntR family transcriptional regulator [unclassified Clostridium]|jgi:DNA-binding GntR family transcriptional regulator|uniref:GntR family transcriptional regulator n=1 Tax=unclassified Clostridium TaxID=2614128 RepID=UPI0011062901|nr:MULTISPECIES: GntR family transcriptional regulator [unclassified Clostridium]